MAWRRWAVLIALWGLGSAGAAVAEPPVDYARQVKPLLASRCTSCHGALHQKAGLRLDTAQLIREGGHGGEVLVPGKSDESSLIERIVAEPAERMPPEGEGSPLTTEEIALLKAWIDQGAHGPADEPVPPDPRLHWAYQRPVKVPLPAVKDPAWGQNPVDVFLAARLDQRGLTPRPEADKATLLRRVALDLTGLPPTRAELHAYLADSSATAYEQAVDRLLQSPQHGERWGRHWMDVWRYSDWYGRRDENDVRNSHPAIWRWRDWIVRSLNADKGYDQMVREMLAADELMPGDDENIVATGYIVRNWYSLNYNQWMRDNVEHTGKAFLGLTFNCCHCHDHKYDPITQQEYFQFRAFFEPLELRRDPVPGEPNPLPFQKYTAYSMTTPVPYGMIRIFDEKLDAETFMYSQGDERNRVANRPAVKPAGPAILGGDRMAIAPVELPLPAYYPGVKAFVREQERSRSQTDIAAAEKGLAEAREALAKIEPAAAEAESRFGPLIAIPEDVVLLETPENAERAKNIAALLAARGGLKARRLALSAAETRLETARAQLPLLEAKIVADDARYRTPSNTTEFEAMARTANQLERAAKVLSAREKRVLAEKALVEAELKRDTAPDMATDADRKKLSDAVEKARKGVATAQKALEEAKPQAEPAPTNTGAVEYASLTPVYPRTSTGRRTALARWIASTENPVTARVAVNHIWMRHFGRPLVSSVFDFGPNGKRPSHPELLDWLAVELMESGWSMKHLHRLIVTSHAYRMQSSAGTEHPGLAHDPDNQTYWHFPVHRMEAEVVRDSLLHLAGRLDLKLGGAELDLRSQADIPRRSLYFTTYAEGGGRLAMLELFDPPDPCDCYRRTSSVVPQQALAITNSPLAIGQSRWLARNLWDQVGTETGDSAAREFAFVSAAFEQILSRGPTAAERTLCETFLDNQTTLYQTPPDSADPAAATTGGEVQPPPAADPRLRARESLVRALFNHNDFVTVR